MVLLDTNVLLYTLAEGSPFHVAARALYQQITMGAVRACVTPQVLCEFLAASTDAHRFQPALTTERAIQELLVFWEAHSLHKIFPTPTTFGRAVTLIRQHRVSRQHVFDAFLVATMLEHGIETIYTVNTKDFVMFKEIRVINPFEARVAS